jgi:uncharacterized phage-associated protein
MTPSQEEFQAWQADPVTRWVFDQSKGEASDLRDQWLQISWFDGRADAEQLAELRTRSATIFTVADRTYEEWMNAHDPA